MVKISEALPYGISNNHIVVLGSLALTIIIMCLPLVSLQENSPNRLGLMATGHFPSTCFAQRHYWQCEVYCVLIAPALTSTDFKQNYFAAFLCSGSPLL